MMLTPEQRDELKAAAYGRGFVHDGLLRAVLAHIDAQSQQLNTQRIMIEAQSAVKGRIRDEASKRGRDASSAVSELDYLIELINAQQARIAELEKDAARYRWLRDHYHGFEHYRTRTGWAKGMFEREIDSAMKEQK